MTNYSRWAWSGSADPFLRFGAQSYLWIGWS